jgi:Spy/CpxP family protein refolding chaperone
MPRPAGMPMMDCPMMSAMMHGPAAALRSGSALELTAGQRTQLDAVQRRLDAVRSPSMDSMRVLHAELMALSKQPKLDEGATRSAFDRMGRMHTEMGLAMLRASQNVSGILTSAQRDSLAAITRRQMPKHGTMPMGAGMAMCGSMMGPSGAPHR